MSLFDHALYSVWVTGRLDPKHASVIEVINMFSSIVIVSLRLRLRMRFGLCTVLQRSSLAMRLGLRFTKV